MPLDCLIRGGLLVRPAEGDVLQADVAIEEGVITAIGPELAGPAGEEIDATGLHVFPGLVDVHVHFNEPGRTEWEGAATGSLALAAGGGTCFCDMPLNASPPTLDGDSFDQKRAALEASSLVDFGLWGGLVPENLDRLEELAERGVIGFKAFLCPSGIEDFGHVDYDTLGRGMEIAARLQLPVGIHAEDAAIVGTLVAEAVAAGRTSVRDFLASRPARAEQEAISCAIGLAEATGCSLHIVHITSGGGVALVTEAQARSVKVTCETCPHYLVLTEDDVERIGAAAKCAPPIRDAAEREALWSALNQSEIAFVASDHSPAPSYLKQSANFFENWGGIAGCQTTLGLMLAEGHLQRGIPLHRIASWTAFAPAHRFGLLGKGTLTIGADADLALVDLAESHVLTKQQLRYRHPISPFLGRTLAGCVWRTMARGQTVLLDGQPCRQSGGRLVVPTRAGA